MENKNLCVHKCFSENKDALQPNGGGATNQLIDFAAFSAFLTQSTNKNIFLILAILK